MRKASSQAFIPNRKPSFKFISRQSGSHSCQSHSDYFSLGAVFFLICLYHTSKLASTVALDIFALLLFQAVLVTEDITISPQWEVFHCENYEPDA